MKPNWACYIFQTAPYITIQRKASVCTEANSENLVFSELRKHFASYEVRKTDGWLSVFTNYVLLSSTRYARGCMQGFTTESYSPPLRAHWFRMAHNESETEGGSTVPLLQITEDDTSKSSLACTYHWMSDSYYTFTAKAAPLPRRSCIPWLTLVLNSNSLILTPAIFPLRSPQHACSIYTRFSLLAL